MEPKSSYPHSQQPAICTYSKTNPFYFPTPFLNIRFNINLPFSPRYSKLSVSLRLPHQNPVCTSLCTHSNKIMRSEASFHARVVGTPIWDRMWRHCVIGFHANGVLETMWLWINSHTSTSKWKYSSHSDRSQPNFLIQLFVKYKIFG